MKRYFLIIGILIAEFACAAAFDAAVPIWIVEDQREINSSVEFSSEFDWDGSTPLSLRLTGCSIFKVFVNGSFAAYGPARGAHGYFRMDEWNIARNARKGRNRLDIVGVAYNTPTYYIVDHAPFLQAEVLSGGKAVRATGDGEWCAHFTDRVRKTERYSLQRAQSEVYEVALSRPKSKQLSITNMPCVKVLERGAPYPTFEVDKSYRPTEILSVKLHPKEAEKNQHL